MREEKLKGTEPRFVAREAQEGVQKPWRGVFGGGAR